MIKIKKSIIFLILFVLFAFIVSDVNAYSFSADSGLSDTGTETGLVSKMDKYNDDLPALIGSIINIALSVLGVIFLGLTIYGGFIWMIARGDSAEVEKAQSIIKNSVIGMAVVLAAYAITKFIYLALYSTSAPYVGF